MYGVDIAKQRLDDLDKQVLEAVALQPAASILELGCGAGGLTSALCAAGAQVTAVDIEDYESVIRVLPLQSGAVTFIQADMRTLPTAVLGRTYSSIVMQRVLHYIPYDDALTLLQTLQTLSSGKLYVSVTGIDTAMSQYYPVINADVHTRFATLDEAGAKLFAITEPVCLYTQTEFVDILIAAGWYVESVWTSAFGNHKAVCT